VLSGGAARAGSSNAPDAMTGIRRKMLYLVRWDANRIAFLKWLLPNRGFELRPRHRRFVMHKRRHDALLHTQKTLLYLLLIGGQELP